MDAPRKEPGRRIRRSSRPTKLALLVAEYIRVQRPLCEASWRWYSSAGSLKEAVRRASWGEREDGEIEEHQRGIPTRSLRELGGRIAQLTIGRARTFAELHDLVRLAAATVPGLETRTIYEVSVRLGAYLRMRPDYVYLHPRACEGAWALWITSKTVRIAPPAFPVELRALRSWEVTEFLDLYRDPLATLRPTRTREARVVSAITAPPSPGPRR